MFKKLKFLLHIQKKQLGKRIDKILSELLVKFSRSKIKKLILDKKIKINEKIIYKPDKKIFKSKKIIVEILLKKVKKLKAQKILLDIIYEDDQLMVVNKPANLVVHPGAGNIDKTLLNGLLYYNPFLINLPRSGIVHRLDKNTTGLIIIAKTIISYNKLIEYFKLKKVFREYEAVVYGIVDKNGTINKPIRRHSKNRIKMITNKFGKKAITHYKVIENFRFNTRLKILLHSGRTHQIRVHMDYINHPLVGDPLYKKKIFLNKSKNFFLLKNFNRQALHAAKLSLFHPITKNKMEWKVKIPNDMQELVNKLRKDKFKNMHNKF